jgi:lipoate-protein ligase A
MSSGFLMAEKDSAQDGRLVVYERFRGRPSADLALEEVLLERAADGEPSLLVTSWPGPVVVLGYGQPAEDVDLELCRGRRIPVLRRITGGTGVVHRNDLGVALALPAGHPWAGGVIALYGRFLDALEPALTAVGAAVSRLAAPRRATRVRSPICFEDQLADTLMVDGRKAVGCAQARRRRAVLIHAAILLGLDAALYAEVFRVSEARVLAALAPAAEVSPQALARELAGRFAAALGLEAERAAPPEVPPRLLDRYREPRWAPVPDVSR